MSRMREHMRDMWISLDASDPSVVGPQPWTVFMEALELLDLLVRVSPVVGWELLFEAAHANRAFAINQEMLFARHELRPRYQVVLDDVRGHAVVAFNAVSRLVNGALDAGLTARDTTAFEPTKRRLLDLWRSQHAGKAFDRAAEGRIDVKLHLVLRSEFNSELARFPIRRTREIAVSSRRNSRPSPLVCAVENIPAHTSALAPQQPNGHPFYLAAMDFAFMGDDVTNELVYVLLDIHDRGLPISELTLDQLIASKLNTIIVGNFLTTLLNPLQTQSLTVAPTSSLHGIRSGGIERLIITSGDFDVHAVEAICSGIAVSQSLREV